MKKKYWKCSEEVQSQESYWNAEIAAAECPNDSPSANRDRLVSLGLEYSKTGRPLESVDALERASLVGPIPDEARIALAAGYAALRRIDLARELYLQLAFSRRLSADLMLQVAGGLAEIDAPQMALQVCDRVIEEDATIAQAHYDMGLYSAASGNALYVTEALIRRAIQLDADSVQYRVGLAALLIQLRREDEALETIRELTVDQIQKANCLTCLGRIEALLDRRGNVKAAQACRERIAKLPQRQARPNHGISGVNAT